MIILALDSCYGICSVAIQINGQTISSIKESVKHKQAELLLPMIESALRKAQLKYVDLEYVAVTIGPGSFTGIRIGLSVAYAIVTTLAKPIIGITSLESIAWQHREDQQIICALDAGRNQFYFQQFNNQKAIGKPNLIKRDELEKLAVSIPVIGNFCKDNIILPDAESTVQIAAAKLAEQNNTTDLVKALYIRLPSIN